jgi:predicted dehydrogenase
LKIGLLGCGPIAQFAHLPALERTRKVDLVAVCDRSEALAQAAAARLNVQAVYSSHEELFADPGVDAVIIAVADAFHVPLASAALQAGKHVLLEKPLGVTSAECEPLVRLVDRTGLKLQVGSMKRHDPGIEFAHQFIQQRLGRILSVSAWYRDSLFRPAMQEALLPPPRLSSDARRPDDDPRAHDRRQYSLVTHGAHLFDNIRYLGGDVRALTAGVAEAFGQYAWHGILEFAHGGAGSFELVVKVNSDWTEGYVIHGEGGSVEVRTFLPFYHRASEVRAFDAATQQWHTPLGADSNAYRRQIEAFAACVLENKPPNPDVREGLAAVRLLEAVADSVATRRRVELPAA